MTAAHNSPVRHGPDAAAETITVFANACETNLLQFKYPNNYIRTTKYTLLTFLPLNLYQQFQKMSNVFFFMNMVIALVPGVSPVFPATTIMPLVAVLGVAAARDAWEDYHRYQSDKRANSFPVEMVRNGQVVTGASKDVRVGELLHLQRGAEVPADCLVLSTSFPDGSCYVETANLDGETNMKPKQAKKALFTKYDTPSATREFSGVITCDSPNVSMHKWQGKISVPSVPDQSVDMDNFLLRGCTVRNVNWVMAVTVYTGVNTKMFLNLTQKPPKVSRLDQKLNRLIIVILVIQQAVILVLCGLYVAFRNSVYSRGFYFANIFQDESDGGAFGMLYMTYFILLSLMMPISLFVSLEFCKAFQAKTMEWDDFMSNGNDRTRARTSSLNEELSQVQYVFTDKTGTLTENQMRFAKAHCGDATYDELSKPGSMAKAIAAGLEGKAAMEVNNFLRLLAVCHTVVVNRGTDNKATYEGSSTDEVALVDAAVKNKVRFLSRTSDSITIQMFDETHVLELDAVLPFTPERKMMSIILRERDGRMHMYTKGADSSVLARLDESSDTNRRKTVAARAFLDQCAREGLRTLVCSERIFTQTQYETWKAKWTEATLCVTGNRQQLMHEAALEAEVAMRFVGCTAIEDRLQDEVPETISFLLQCGIVVWVLTGDKRETAVNIATTSRLLNPLTDVVVHLDIANGKSAAEQINDATAKVKEAATHGRKSTFVVDGASLEVILQEATYDSFRHLGLLVNSAVCCRVTPLQKARVVTMFQQLGSTCLGVGDGANDVSMIQEARVGIGILGLEGSQAERASDYAIPRFRHLRRLLAIHGRYSLIRNSNLIQYSFYKNIVYSLIHVYYAFYNGFSGQTIFDSWVIIFFNMAFTLFPPLVIGLFDYDVRDSFLMKHPALYNELRSPFAVRMSRVTSLLWSLLAIGHSWVIYFGVHKSFIENDSVLNGWDAGMWTSGTVSMNLLLTVVITQACFSFLSWTWLHVLSIVLSYVAYYLFIFAYAALPPSLGYSEYYNVPTKTMEAGSHWLVCMLWFVVLFAPEMLVKVARSHYFGTQMHAARRVDAEEKKQLPWTPYTPGSSSGPPPIQEAQRPLIDRNTSAVVNDSLI